MNLDSLKDTVFKFLKLENLISNLSGFIEARVELLKLEIQEDVARVLANALVYAAIMLFFFFLLIFLSVGLAHWIGTRTGASYIGYWAVAGIYGFVFAIFLVFRKTVSHNFEKHFSEMIRRKRN